jgi:hypothetical protein
LWWTNIRPLQLTGLTSVLALFHTITDALAGAPDSYGST